MRPYLFGFAVCLLLIPVGLSVDVPVAKWMSRGGLPGDLDKAINLCEFFGHLAGAFLICLAVYVLDRQRRDNAWRLLAAGLITGAVVDLFKITIVRQRPHTIVDLADWSGSVWDTFHGFAWHFESDLQSFPSGHTGLAMALALGLTRFYPHGGRLFFFCAGMAALQRIASRAHFVSDVLGGAGLAFLVSGILFHAPRIGNWFPPGRNVSSPVEADDCL